MTAPALSVVLPAYGEAESLRTLLPALRTVVADLGVPAEILVVDAAPPRDDTAALCAALGVRCVPREGGSAYGHAVRTGIRRAAGDRVLFMDADGSHPPAFVATLWARRTEADLLVASRYVAGGDSDNPRPLVLLSRALNLLFRGALDLDVADVSNSLRLYRGDHLRALELASDHFDVVEEILVRLVDGHPGYRVLEVPFRFERRRTGTSKRSLGAFLLGYLATLRRLRRVRRSARRGSA